MNTRFIKNRRFENIDGMTVMKYDEGLTSDPRTMAMIMLEEGAVYPCRIRRDTVVIGYVKVTRINCENFKVTVVECDKDGNILDGYRKRTFDSHKGEVRGCTDGIDGSAKVYSQFIHVNAYRERHRALYFYEIDAYGAYMEGKAPAI